jgi:FtsZ-interacting cell division protein ZipA
MHVSGLTLLLDVPRVGNPAMQFDVMVQLARRLAGDFRATLVDDHRMALGENALAHIRAQVSTIEDRMLAGGVSPGSSQALRLFS